MTNSNILAIFLVCLSAGIVLATPHSYRQEHFKDSNICQLKEIYSSLAPTTKDHNLKPTIQLMKVVMFDLSDLGLTYVQRAKEISNQVLRDQAIGAGKQPAATKFKHEIEEFERKYNECKEMEQLFDLMDLYSNATSHYYEQEKEGTLNADSKIVYDVLKKYSPQDLDEEFEHKFLNIFVHKFGQKINEVRASLQKEGDIGVKILQWWDQTKALKTTEEQMEAFKEYMKLYGIDDE